MGLVRVDPRTNDIVSGFLILGTGVCPDDVFCNGFNLDTLNLVRVRPGPGQWDRLSQWDGINTASQSDGLSRAYPCVFNGSVFSQLDALFSSAASSAFAFSIDSRFAVISWSTLSYRSFFFTFTSLLLFQCPLLSLLVTHFCFWFGVDGSGVSILLVGDFRWDRYFHSTHWYMYLTSMRGPDLTSHNSCDVIFHNCLNDMSFSPCLKSFLTIARKLLKARINALFLRTIFCE